jgi:hypothetical protein
MTSKSSPPVAVSVCLQPSFLVRVIVTLVHVMMKDMGVTNLPRVFPPQALVGQPYLDACPL